ncbi:hypothetical protein ACOSZF_05170 [Cytobacillus firmus]|uniref:hypothetical protein n=1 Tax=Cytobacillus firmus TaxID=1399 RepID=UPI0018CC9B9E|nr:hypothetical protein [Cytobacillus firmus]MBG9548920.1 hypothetical protein [Cytobacillus firmus]MBG9602215.1 hypothetical protein [Cytobacillus firmus]MED1940141.1 hypothetical protein [Cytobacillus firmus]
MKATTLIRLMHLVIPWLTIVFLPKKSFNKFSTVSVFAGILVLILSTLAIPFKWWTVEGGHFKKLLNDLTFILGPFFIGTLWIFHFTFGSFKKYLAVNAIMDLLFAYPLNYLYQRFKLYKLEKFKPIHIFLFFTSYAWIIYGYQEFFHRNHR